MVLVLVRLRDYAIFFIKKLSLNLTSVVSFETSPDISDAHFLASMHFYFLGMYWHTQYMWAVGR